MTKNDFEKVTLEAIEKAFKTLQTTKLNLSERGWFPATSGNLSIRVKNSSLEPDPPIIAITSSGKDKSIDTPEDFILIDSHGNLVFPTNLKPSAETLIHTAIYQSIPNCEAVFHVHTIYNNLISDLYGDQGKVTFTKHEIIKALDIWKEDASITVPIVENYASIPKLAEEIGKVIQPGVPGVLIRNHGIYVWGDSDFTAKRHLEAFEFLFEYQIKMFFLKKFNQTF
ncbi:methylthioribulose 1-phosphate dehydratase [Peribacillus simplex]|uniref:methylthioribulose 1-phosphate dehydratase n=1 Tax=Peribacillus simplex TaxID=1478 RepID=UPI0010BE68CB|nr:methylthioribulose 1-phosphate dehydratase [Peribacillus simplex]TKH03353.1 methylthioribulose 1-phosphate dehydratase [Peribacillus simplex]